MRKTKEIYSLSGETIFKYSGPGWRLVYNNTSVVGDIFYSDGITQTKRSMEVFDTSGETLTEIIVLGLNYSPASSAGDEVDSYLNDL